MNTTSVRLPDPLRERVRAHARVERRSFSNAVRVLIEAGLDATETADVDDAEIERLADLARETLHEHGLGPNDPYPGPIPNPFPSPPNGGGGS